MRGGSQALVLAGLFALAGPASALEWKVLEPGLALAREERAGTTFHIVKADLATHTLGMADARRADRKVARVDVLREEAHALVAVNANFFDTEWKPLGLVRDGDRELNPLRPISWWAAFVVRHGHADLLTTAQLSALDPAQKKALSFAVQVGPRTVVDGQPLKHKAQVADRTAIGVLASGEVILVATEGAGVESNALAAWMKAIGVRHGLMLDGGPSTQLSLAVGDESLEVAGGYGVPTAVVVKRR